jgi:hypothetical protein
MKDFLFAGIILGLFVMGCNLASNNSAPTNGNQSQAGASPLPANNTRSASSPSGANSNQSSGQTRNNNPNADVTGAYFAVGTLPAAFSEIEHISLATIDDQGNPAPLNGFIRPRRRSAEDYRLNSVELNGNDLSFTTATVGGVSYRFRGRFARLDNFAANPPDTEEVILSGTLTKTENGTTTEAPVRFTYSAGG